MREGGLEPPNLAAPDPKSGVSANSTTPAQGCNLESHPSVVSSHGEYVGLTYSIVRGGGYIIENREATTSGVINRGSALGADQEPISELVALMRSCDTLKCVTPRYRWVTRVVKE